MRCVKFALLLLALLALVALTLPLWLGRVLIHDEAPVKADIAVVLAGDQWGLRVLKAAELARAGYVPAVLVSGPPYYDMHECDAAIAFAVNRGFPRELFIPLPNSALSTREEARAVLDELARRNVRSFLLVTSNYHTARSQRIYRSEESHRGGGPEFHTVAAPDRYFTPTGWWRSRESLKLVFFETSKTLATAVGM